MIGYAYEGLAVEVAGWGAGYVSRVTRGATPYHVKLVTGGRAGEVVRCASRHMSEVDAETAATIERARIDALVEQRDALNELTLGTVVRYTSAKYNPSGALHVVIGAPKNDRVKLARLGGDGNRYLTVPVRNVTVVHAEVVSA